MGVVFFMPSWGALSIQCLLLCQDSITELLVRGANLWAWEGRVGWLWV